MKIEEFETLNKRIDQASKVLSDKYELSLRIEHLKMIIKGGRSVYDSKKDKRRYPTTEEIERASSDLEIYLQKTQLLDAQFAAL